MVPVFWPTLYRRSEMMKQNNTVILLVVNTDYEADEYSYRLAFQAENWC